MPSHDANGPRFSIVSPSGYDEWNAFAEGPNGKFTQATWWAEPMRPFGMDFDVVAAHDGSEILGGALVRWARPRPIPVSRGICLGGPVFTNWSGDMARPLLDGLSAASRRRRGIEIVFVDVPDATIVNDLVYELTTRGAHFNLKPNSSHAVIDLAGRTSDEVIKGMRERARRSIRRGRRSLRFEAVVDDAALSAAYDAFQATAERKGFAMRPPQAGLNTIREAIDRDVGTVIGAIDDDGAIVAAVFVTFVGDEAVYEYGGYLESASDKRPNHALHAEAIAMAIDRGFDVYNMGVLSAKTTDTGVNDFKISFGAAPRPRTERLQWATMPLAGRVMNQLSTSRRGQDLIRTVRKAVAARA